MFKKNDIVVKTPVQRPGLPYPKPVIGTFEFEHEGRCVIKIPSEERHYDIATASELRLATREEEEIYEEKEAEFYLKMLRDS
jgi:hypothetical protein